MLKKLLIGPNSLEMIHLMFMNINIFQLKTVQAKILFIKMRHHPKMLEKHLNKMINCTIKSLMSGKDGVFYVFQ